MPIESVKEIPVAYFRDDSHGNKQIMVGRGLDGVLYTFIVTPRVAIPYFQNLSDDSYHGEKADEKLPEPEV
jgi:hypothetical protein